MVAPCYVQWLLDEGVMAPLLRLLADGDGVVRQKGLMALSCLVRHSQPAVQQFHEVRTLGADAVSLSNNTRTA